ncbi:MAG: hypothetical protein QXO69_00465 [archaeon]
MKQYEKILILMAALIVIVVIGSFVKIQLPDINEKPKFEFSEQTGIKSTMPDNKCRLEFNASVTNTGGAAKVVIVKAEVIEISGVPAAETIIPIGSLGEGEKKFFSGKIIANITCSDVSRVKLSVTS